MEPKTCPICSKKLSGKNITGYCYEHRSLSEHRKKWRKKNEEENIDRRRELDRKRYHEGIKKKESLIRYKNKDRNLYNEKRRKYYQENIEKMREYDRNRDRREYNRKNYHSSPTRKIGTIMSVSLKRFIKDKNGRKTFSIIKHSKEEYLKTLEKRFDEEYFEFSFSECLLSGEWHIDHIIPVSIARNEEDVIKLFSPENLRLIPSEENLKKNNKLDKDLIKRYNLNMLYEEINGVKI